MIEKNFVNVVPCFYEIILKNQVLTKKPFMESPKHIIFE